MEIYGGNIRTAQSSRNKIISVNTIVYVQGSDGLGGLEDEVLNLFLFRSVHVEDSL